MSTFDRIYRENFRFVWAAAHRCGVPAEAVEDVVQDVFITAHRRLHELDWEVSARGWLYGVTRNVAMRHRRGSARRSRREAMVARESARAVHPHRRHDAARTLDALLTDLSARLREVFEMSEVLGMSAPEIAAELGVPANTVYSRLRLARRKLVAQAGSLARLERDVAAVHEANTPTAGDRERTHAALLPLLQAPWWSIPALLGSVAKPALVAVMGVAALAGYAVLTDEEAPSPTSPAAVEHPPGTAQLSPPIPAAAVVSTPVRPPPPRSVVPPMPSVRSTGSSPTRSAVFPSGAATPALSTDTLADEIALLDRARAVLARGDPDASLQLLDEYDERFPGGQLLAVRSATRARAGCLAKRGEKTDPAVASTGVTTKTQASCPKLVTDSKRGGEP